MQGPDDEFRTLQILPAAAEALTPQQERFNALVRDLALWRTAVAQWKDALDRYDRVVEPVRRELLQAWRQWVLGLDTATHLPGLARGERAQLDEMLREGAQALLQVQPTDAGMAELLARHAPQAEEPAEASAAAAQDDWEQLAEHWERQADAAAAQRERQAASRRLARAARRGSEKPPEVSQSLRDVFRKLASVLHPDREPDAEARARKTALMQQANQAHARQDLLTLLQLQLQAEQVDAARMAALDDRRLQHYVTVLEGQLTDLQAEARRLEAEFRAATGMPPGAGLPPRKIERIVAGEARRMREEVQGLQGQAKWLADVAAVKDWLRQERRP